MKPKHLSYLILALLFCLIVWSFGGCQTVNLSKKSDNTCTACYGYLLEHCPQIAQKDSVNKQFLFTVNGINVHDTIRIKDICNQTTKSGTYNILSTKKQKNLNLETKIIDNDKIVIDCKSDTVFIETKVSVPCNYMFTNTHAKLYVEAKVKNAWNKSKWWMLGIIALMTTTYFLRSRFSAQHS